jgi:hypothetical protein
VILEFLSRPGCHLCEQALPVVEVEVARIGGMVEVVDIDVAVDHTRLERFGARVPVLLGPGEIVLAEGVISRRALRRALRRLSG